MRTKTLTIFVLATAWLLFATGANSSQATMSNRLETARATIGADWPVSTERRATTDGGIYLANLNGQIAALEQRLDARPDPRLSAQQARLLYHRFQVLGRLEDAEAARDMLSLAARNAGAQASLDYAHVLIGFHEFDKASEALDAAARHEALAPEVAAVRQAIAQARGQVKPMLEPRDVSPRTPSPVSLVSQAAAWLDHDRPELASKLLRLAQDRYTDSSPYTLAWIQVHQGIVFLEYEDYESARLFFAAAHERFPQYTLAAEHLAETELALGNPETAARIYREVAERTGHPEFHFQLSQAESQLGNDEKAAQSVQLARQGYERLVERYPLMYADHAVDFYVGMGDREQAVELAQANLSQRQDKRSEALLAKARECCR